MIEDLQALLYDGLSAVVNYTGDLCMHFFGAFSNVFVNLLHELSPSLKNIGIDFFTILDNNVNGFSVMSFDLIFWALGLMIAIFILKPIFTWLLNVLDIT